MWLSLSLKQDMQSPGRAQQYAGKDPTDMLQGCGGVEAEFSIQGFWSKGSTTVKSLVSEFCCPMSCSIWECRRKGHRPFETLHFQKQKFRGTLEHGHRHLR